MVRSMFYVKIENDEEDRSPEKIRFTFHKKCYICENELTENGHREHRIPKCTGGIYKSLISNYFWACARCNNIKDDEYYELSNECRFTDGYCGVIDCTKCDPNEYVGIRISGELKTEIEVIEKKYAPCNKHTILLLRKVYCSSEKMDTINLSELKKKIIYYLWPLEYELKVLYIACKAKNPKSEVDEIKRKVLDCASPKKPFFAIKLSYIEDMYNKHLNSGFDKILEDILQDSSFHPIVNDCCSHKNSISD